MLVYSDIFTNDEVVSDSYKQLAPFDLEETLDIAFEVESRRVCKGQEDYGISANVDENAEEGAVGESGGDAVTVIDVIDSFNLQEYPMSKNDFKAYIKGYMGHLVKYLSANHDNRVAAFKTGSAKLFKKVLEEWDSVEIYMSSNYSDYSAENKALPIIAYYKGEEVTPRFVFLKDGLKEIKC